MTEVADFSNIDPAEATPLVAMMAATDSWPAVRSARQWTLEQAADAIDVGGVLDVGCGPGTFGAVARSLGWRTVELDRSAAMLGALRDAHGVEPVAVADVQRLPVRDASVGLARCERVLQWVDEPDVGLAELWRVAAPGGVAAVTDTDWSTFAVDAPEAWMSELFAEAALRWVPNPTFASTLAGRLRQLGATSVRTEDDHVELSSWDPDVPDQKDGPLGLPLHSIAAAVVPEHRDAAATALASIADAARRGRFAASLTVVTALAIR